jgi:hypothetical protein
MTSLPESISAGDVEAINEALALLFGRLRLARSLPLGKTDARPSAVVALGAVCRFLEQFEPALTESLLTPLLNLQSALLALNENNIQPVLKPVKRTGRAPSSHAFYALIGFAVGVARQLEWTELSPRSADKVVAQKLSVLGIMPTRGKNGVTAGTLHHWRHQIDAVEPAVRSLPVQLLQSELRAEDLGWITAAFIASTRSTDEWRRKITAIPRDQARDFALSTLEAMALDYSPKSPS